MHNGLVVKQAKRSQDMNTKRIKLLAAAIGLAGLSGTAAASGNVSFGIYAGAPAPVYVAPPASVYVAPRVV